VNNLGLTYNYKEAILPSPDQTVIPPAATRNQLDATILNATNPIAVVDGDTANCMRENNFFGMTIPVSTEKCLSGNVNTPTKDCFWNPKLKVFCLLGVCDEMELPLVPNWKLEDDSGTDEGQSGSSSKDLVGGAGKNTNREKLWCILTFALVIYLLSAIAAK
jgi:hypothetical protein